MFNSQLDLAFARTQHVVSVPDSSTIASGGNYLPAIFYSLKLTEILNYMYYSISMYIFNNWDFPSAALYFHSIYWSALLCIIPINNVAANFY